MLERCTTRCYVHAVARSSGGLNAQGGGNIVADLVAYDEQDIVCAFCHTAISGERVECERCHSAQHVECAAASGSCPTLGCTGASEGHPESRPDAPASAVGPADDSALGADSVSAGSGGARSRVPLVVLGIACVVLPLLAIFGTKANWFAPFTGKLVTEKSAKAKAKKAEVRGYRSGSSDGFDSGYEAGKTAGYASGMTAGCEWVFDTLDTFQVYDTHSFFLTATYLTRSQCL